MGPTPQKATVPPCTVSAIGPKPPRPQHTPPLPAAPYVPFFDEPGTRPPCPAPLQSTPPAVMSPVPQLPAFSVPPRKIPAAPAATAAPAAPRLDTLPQGTGITVDRRSSLDAAKTDVTHARIHANREIADLLDAASCHTQARHVRECQTHLQAMVCDTCKSTWYAPTTCKTRLCAICGPRKARKDARLALELFARAKSPKWMTLTMQRAPNLALGLDHLKDAFRNWRRNPRIAALLKGGLYHIEVKAKDDGWHIHLHALIDSAYIPKPVLYKSWAQALGQETASVQINRISGNKLIQYITKYALKPADIRNMSPAQLDAYVRETRKRRLLGTWGTWYNQTLQKLLDTDPQEPAKCPNCHSVDTTYPIRAGPRRFGNEYWRPYLAAYWPDVAPVIQDPQWCDNPAPAPAQDAAPHEEWF